MGAFRGGPQKAQSLRLDVQIETRQNYSFVHLNHQFTVASRKNVGTLLARAMKSQGDIFFIT
jgi:hypothetical protein